MGAPESREVVGKVAMSALVMVMGARRQGHQKPASWAHYTTTPRLATDGLTLKAAIATDSLTLKSYSDRLLHTL